MSENNATEASADTTSCPSGSSTSNPGAVQGESAGQPVGNAPATNTIVNMQPKSRVAYVLLAIFLGEFGVHNFYAGYVGRGLAQILLTIVGGSFTCGVTAAPVWLWAIVEACVISKDARGVPFN